MSYTADINGRFLAHLGRFACRHTYHPPAPLVGIGEKLLVRIDSHRVAYHLQHRYVLDAVTVSVAGGQVHIEPGRLDEAADKTRSVISMTVKACKATGIAIADLLQGSTYSVFYPQEASYLC